MSLASVVYVEIVATQHLPVVPVTVEWTVEFASTVLLEHSSAVLPVTVNVTSVTNFGTEKMSVVLCVVVNVVSPMILRLSF